MIILFRNQSIANTWKKEICVTPSGVWLWIAKPVNPSDDVLLSELGDPDGTPNVVTSPVGEDGTVIMEHGFSEEDIAFFKEYCDSAIKTGDIQLLDAIPAGWKAKADKL